MALPLSVADSSILSFFEGKCPGNLGNTEGSPVIKIHLFPHPNIQLLLILFLPQNIIFKCTKVRRYVNYIAFYVSFMLVLTNLFKNFLLVRSYSLQPSQSCPGPHCQVSAFVQYSLTSLWPFPWDAQTPMWPSSKSVTRVLELHPTRKFLFLGFII